MIELIIIYVICTIISLGLFIAFCFSPKSKIHRHKKWHIILVAIIFVAFSPLVMLTVIYIIIEGCFKKIYYRHRPRPIPKNIRHYLKDGLVVDNDGQVLSIEEYNQLHNTSYNLEDVYGSTKWKNKPEFNDFE